MLRGLITRIKAYCIFLFGYIISNIMYDKTVFRSRWFNDKRNKIFAIGWKWAIYDVLSRLSTGNNRKAKYPISSRCRVVKPGNIVFDPDDLNIFQTPGAYFQAIGKIIIGKGTYIGPNCGLITANHDITNLDKHQMSKGITIGESCWLGMNSVILPGVTLGKHTIVGAGAVVTHSFPEGNCVIGGNPAHTIKKISFCAENSEVKS